MILYVNGDSHSAGAEAVNSYSFANDDPLYQGLGRIPHPDNEKVSYGCELANTLGAILHCDAESASSNQRIIRTTRDYLKDNKPDYVIIGWSTWEREEFWDHETHCYWQVNAGGIGHDWPENIKDQYKKYIANVDYEACRRNWHARIYEFSQELNEMGVGHLFFNSFDALPNFNYEWGNNYLEPYNPEMTYYNWCKIQGFKTVRPESYHYGPDAHRAWADYLLQTIVQKALTN